MAEVLGVPFAGFAAALLGVFLGTLVQRLAGQGFGMVAAPVIGLVAPQYLPASLLFLGIFVGLSSAALNLSYVNRAELPAGFAGRTLGAVIAAFLALWLAGSQHFALVVAGVVFLGIALSLLGIRVPIGAASLFSAGTIAGIMGTLTAVGAPPMALLYQHEESRRAATMQNVFFFWGMIVSILSLLAVGLVRRDHILFACALAPAAMLALLLAERLKGRFERRAIRPWALGLAGIAASVLAFKALV